MRREHELGRLYVQGMHAVLEAAAKGEPEAVRWFTLHGQSYIRLLREHIGKEDHCLFARAESVMTAQDDDTLQAAYGQFEAADLGRDAREVREDREPTGRSLRSAQGGDSLDTATLVQRVHLLARVAQRLRRRKGTAITRATVLTKWTRWSNRIVGLLAFVVGVIVLMLWLAGTFAAKVPATSPTPRSPSAEVKGNVEPVRLFLASLRIRGGHGPRLARDFAGLKTACPCHRGSECRSRGSSSSAAGQSANRARSPIQ